MSTANLRLELDAAADELAAALDELERVWKSNQLLLNPKLHSVRQGIAEKLRQEKLWQAGIGQVSNDWASEMMLKADEAIQYAISEWKVQKDKHDEPPPEAAAAIPPLTARERTLAPAAAEVMSRLTYKFPEGPMAQGAQTVYIGLAGQTGTASGQAALENLGLNKTFAFAHPQNMGRAFYDVRGSKVIQAMYDDHIQQLTDLIIGATNPRHPKTIAEVKAAINKQWPGMRAYQVDRIARTETASVWSSTAMTTYQANGITQWSSVIAHGPSIPGSPEYNPEATIQTEDPCDECQEMADNGPYTMDDDIPPWHPNCRCEAIPVLEDANGDPWLPPDEPWAGGGDTPDPSDVQLSRHNSDHTHMSENPDVKFSSEKTDDRIIKLRKRLRLP